DVLREPVRGVVLAQSVALLRRDHRLVENFHYVVVHLAPGEARGATRERANESLAARHLNGPIKEIGLDDIADLCLLEQSPGAERRRRQLWVGYVIADDGVRDRLGGQNEKSVVHEQLVGVRKSGAQRRRQKSSPQLALELDG